MRLREHAGAFTHAALDPRYRFFSALHTEGSIGFRLVGRCAFVQGDPSCRDDQLRPLMDAFDAHCSANGWSIVVNGASQRMIAHAREHGYGTIDFARLLYANLQRPGGEKRHVRQNVRRTQRHGVVVTEYRGHEHPDPALEQRVDAAVVRWQTARRGPQSYIAAPRLFTSRPGRRWFVAERAGQVVGAVSLLRVGLEDCDHHLNLVFATPDAPDHTCDLLVVTAMAKLREEGARWLSFGIVPLDAPGETAGFGKLTTRIIPIAWRLAARRLKLRNKAVFWEKFGVERREPSYLLFSRGRIGLAETRALLVAFAPGGPGRPAATAALPAPSGVATERQPQDDAA